MADSDDRKTDRQQGELPRAEWRFDPQTGRRLDADPPRFLRPTGGWLVAQIVWAGLIVMVTPPQMMLKDRSALGVLVGGATLWLIGAGLLAGIGYAYRQWRSRERHHPGSID